MSANPEQTFDEAPSDFLRSLVDAMRRVVEATRDRTLAEMRDAVETEAGQLDMTRSTREAALRERAEAEITGIGSWERAEMERIRADALRKVQARGGQLDQELAELAATATAEHAALAARADAYEREVAAFIQGLDGIQDPAAFAAAARRMPSPWAPNAHPPSLTGPRMSAVPAAAEAPPSEPVAPEAASPEAASSEAASPEQAKPEPVTPVMVVPEGASAGERSSVASATDASAADVVPAEPVAAEPVAPVPVAAEPAKAESVAPVPVTAEPAKAESVAPVPVAAEPAKAESVAPVPVAAEPAVPEPLPDQATSIQVHGLGSFGAITSFKQSLERVNGIRSVTLGLGPSGEFVYTATHAPTFDLGGAIRAIEGEGVEIERDNGTLKVRIGKGAKAG